MSPTSEADSESHLRNLASLVAECRQLAQRLDGLRDAPDRRSAPFLHRQLSQVLQLLEQSTRTALEWANDAVSSSAASEGGFFGRLKRSFRGAQKREAESSTEGLQGNSWTIAIPELIGFLSTARKTGALWVHAPDETFLLQIRDGVLVHATSDQTPEGERLGELLVAAGALSADELASFLEQEKSSQMLGIGLYRAKRIREEDLVRALTNQVQRLFDRMLNSRHSVFRFQEGAQILVEHHVRLNVMQLLLETARMFDERTAKDLPPSAAAAERPEHALVEAVEGRLTDMLEKDAEPKPVRPSSADKGGETALESAAEPAEKVEPLAQADGAGVAQPGAQPADPSRK
jgi:hypothetical protein